MSLTFLEVKERLVERYDVDELLALLGITDTAELADYLEERIEERMEELQDIFSDEDLPFSEFPE